MKVVLLKPRKKLGKIGEVVEVKDGFGRNYLIPQKLATRATEANLKFFEDKKHELEEKNNQFLSEAQSAAKMIEGKDFVFIRQCSDDGRLFGSVSAKEIAKEVAKISPIVSNLNIVLVHPLKSLGVYEVLVHLHVDVESKIIVNIARSETEAQDALKAFKGSSENEVEAA